MIEIRTNWNKSYVVSQYKHGNFEKKISPKMYSEIGEKVKDVSEWLHKQSLKRPEIFALSSKLKSEQKISPRTKNRVSYFFNSSNAVFCFNWHF